MKNHGPPAGHNSKINSKVYENFAKNFYPKWDKRQVLLVQRCKYILLRYVLLLLIYKMKLLFLI